MPGNEKPNPQKKKEIPLTYKRKVSILSALVALLVLIFILSLVFDPENRRSDAFAWLDSSLMYMADGIDISTSGGSISLSRKNNVWLVNTETGEFPVRQSRVDDLFAALTHRNVYPLRATSSEARERLGVADERASRIVIRGGAGLPLLDLLIGGEDVFGREVYLRRSDQNHIYSGEDNFSLFLNLMPSFWYNLRFFDDISIDSVQQVDITLPGAQTVILRRSGIGWVLSSGESLDTTRVESWLRSVIEAQGEDFFPGQFNPSEIEGTITLRIGDGTNRSLLLGPKIDEDFWIATADNSPFSYALADWNFARLFRESSYFLRD